MLKFLRKYNKFILVVGGVMLMVAFLAPQAIQQAGKMTLFQPTVAELGGEKVKRDDLLRADLEVRSIERLLPGLVQSLNLDPDHENEHWLLLAHAAREGGFVGGSADGRAWISELATTLVQQSYLANLQSQFGGFYPQNFLAQQALQYMESDDASAQVAQVAERLVQQRSQIAGQHRMTETEFDEVLGLARGIYRMQQSYLQVERAGANEAVVRAKRMLDQVRADVLWIPATTFLDDAPEPTAEQLQAQFETYREENPGEGDHGFGYRLAPRVKLEWLVLDRAQFEAAAPVSVLDVARAHQENRTQYPGDLETERTRIERDLRRAKGERLLDAAQAIVQAEINGAMHTLKREGDYRVVPDGWAAERPTADQLADTLVQAMLQREGVTLPRPEVQRADRWIEIPRGFVDYPALARAGLIRGSRAIPLAQALLQVREIAGDNGEGLQVGVPIVSTNVRDAVGNRYFVTVLDAAKAGVPESIEDLPHPEIVTEDWQRLQVYESLAARTEEFCQLAIADGLEAVVTELQGPPPEATSEEDAADGESDLVGPEPGEVDESADDGDATVDDTQSAEGEAASDVETTDQEGDAEPETPEQPRLQPAEVTFSREGVVGAPVLNTDAFRDAGFSLAEALDPLTPVADAPSSERTFGVAIPESLGVAIAQVEFVRPLTIETYRVYGDQAIRASLLQEMQEQAAEQDLDPFTLEALSRRFGYELRDRGDGA